MYVTTVTETRRSPRAIRAKAKRPPVRRLRADSAVGRPKPATRGTADVEAGVAVAQDDALYREFQRQLRTLLSNGPARPKKIEEALGLVPLQARKWLERMERGGEIERACRRPVTYALTRKSLL